MEREKYIDRFIIFWSNPLFEFDAQGNIIKLHRRVIE